MAEAIVVGGGIAGLACGLRLHAAGVDVEVWEEEDEPGGHVRTIAEEGFRMERGPHTFLGSSDDVFALAAEAGAEAELVPALASSAVRFIARGGRLHEVFTGPIGFLRSGLISWRGKWDLATEVLRTRRGREDDSAAEFFERRFGPEAARVLAGAFVSGVYAGDPERLSAPAAFPLFWGFEKEWGGMVRGGVRHMLARRRARRALGAAAPPLRKGLWSLRGGLGTLSRAAARTLGSALVSSCGAASIARDGVAWRVSAGSREAQARFVVVAAPPPRASVLLAAVDRDLGEAIAGVAMAPLAVAHLGFRGRLAEIPDAFGFLVPRGEGIRTLGVLFPSRMFGDRAPAGGDLLTGFVGGSMDRAAMDLEDGDLVRTVMDDVGRLTGLAREPDHVRVLRYAAAIPQLEHGHLGRMRAVRKRLSALPGLVLAGNYLGGVGMKDAIGSGMEAAARVIEES